MWGTRRWVAGVLVAALVAVGCSGDDDSDKADASSTTEPADLKAEFTSERSVDATRSTPESKAGPAHDSRTLVTRIAYPSPLQGKHPLIVFAHGLGGNPARHTDLMTAWAKAGYIVAAPAFPRTND